ncbi:MAG: hypothetical protein K0Q48_2234 [Bacillota bacterium]|jgi:hypothetical protein|nr:hypothetical protein [Bacillota bacterium]
MKETVQANEVEKVTCSVYRITRKFEGEASAEALILNLIKAHTQNA